MSAAESSERPRSMVCARALSSARMTDIAAPGTALSTAPATAAVCPYLLGVDGAWRSSGASRDHRCHAVSPAAMLSTDKQRRLCLVAEHVGCSTYGAAMAAFEEAGSVLERPLHRAVTRTAPLVLDRGRITLSVPGLSDRGISQGSLVALMAVAFGALAITRLGGGPELRPAAVEPDATRTPAAAESVAPSDATTSPDTGTPPPTLVPSGGEESAAPPAKTQAPAKTAKPTAKPVAGGSGTTYEVQSGDTLSGIAAEHGTTWQALARLNKLDDPRRLRVGQVLEIP
jgi:LysM repeat protein